VQQIFILRNFTHEKICANYCGWRRSTYEYGYPKTIYSYNGKPVLMHTISRFHDYDHAMEIIVIIPRAHVSLWKDLCLEFNFKIKHQIVNGGKERFYSVKNGLKVVDENSLVLIHDGVRPLVSNETIKRVVEVSEEKGNAIPYIDMYQSVRKVNSKGNKAIDRSQLKLIQTPQGFHSSLIKEAYAKRYRKSFTDDASVLEVLHHEINLVKGNHKNIKITSSTDLHLVDCLMRI